MMLLRLYLRYAAVSEDSACVQALRQIAGERGLNQAALQTLRLGLPLYRQHLLDMVRGQDAGGVRAAATPATEQTAGGTSVFAPSTLGAAPARIAAPAPMRGALVVPEELERVGKAVETQPSEPGAPPLSEPVMALLKQWD